jgi:enamine deaminase RidA (YjgF/YER057c/UK114 family)
VSADARFAELKLELPPAPKAVGVYKPVVQVDRMLYFSGHGPLKPDGTMIQGRVGENMDTKGAYNAARQTGLAMLATMKAHCGSFDRIARIVKVLGLVNAAPTFGDHPAVINGFSELMRDLFGPDAGVGARSAVGAGSLPGGIAVEIEAIFELKS